MTTAQLDHLRAISDFLTKLLSDAEKRTPGRWHMSNSSAYHVASRDGDISSTNLVPDTVFIASCAGNAEAGWRATRAAIARALNCPRCGGTGITSGWVPSYADPSNVTMAPEAEPCCEQVKDILAAFPLESLK